MTFGLFLIIFVYSLIVCWTVAVLREWLKPEPPEEQEEMLRKYINQILK